MAEGYLVSIIEEMEINIEELEDKVPYHKGLLQQLKTNPMTAKMVLRPSELSNISWKLAENNIFKEHVDPQVYRELAKCYQIHDYLNMQAKEAGERMSEINILGPYYMLAATNQDPSKEEIKEIQLSMKKGWIPIFETWTAMEENYLKHLKELLLSLE